MSTILHVLYLLAQAPPQKGRAEKRKRHDLENRGSNQEKSQGDIQEESAVGK